MTNDIPQPPVAARRPHVFSQHGVEIEDPYFWLRDPGYPDVKDKDVLSYLEAENAWFEQAMAPHNGLIDDLFSDSVPTGIKAILREELAAKPGA